MSQIENVRIVTHDATQEDSQTRALEPPKAQYFLALDGIRGLAILAVILFHNYGVRGGWVGVDLFFALSGFLITRILTKARGSKGYYKRFYIRRTLRIFPVYYLVVGLVALGDPAAREHILWYVAYLSDFYGLMLEIEIPALQHSWSLAIEEQFYLIWPAAVAALAPQRLRQLCLAGLLLPMIARTLAIEWGLHNTFINFNILTRCDPLFLGAILGSLAAERTRDHWRAGNTHRWAWFGAVFFGLVMVGALVGTERSFRQYPTPILLNVAMVAIACACACVIWLAYLERSALLTRFLCLRPLRALGRISYGVYLFHEPINVHLEPVLESAGLINRWINGTLLFGATILVSALSWRVFESPINSLKDRWAPAPQE